MDSKAWVAIGGLVVGYVFTFGSFVGWVRAKLNSHKSVLDIHRRTMEDVTKTNQSAHDDIVEALGEMRVDIATNKTLLSTLVNGRKSA